ncbi:MAG TPA: ABC transporter ATP-binding protein [Ktedonobacteraceae bacterium]|nr:ABC transporter ATP-binding protein [Ktedonobacteraceae bacterium]
MSRTVELRHFGRRFRNDAGFVQAVADVNLRAEPGEFVALVGPSGCGKSTILRAIAGLDAGYSGEVLADGVAITGQDTSRGIIFQEPRLFPWLTVSANIGFGLRTPAQRRKEQVHELIELVGLSGFEQAYPYQLSGGMAQRAAIARALAPQPDVLLLDEPFGALDAFTRMRLQDALEEIWLTRRMTTLLVTHDIDEALALSQRVVVMTPRPGHVARVLEIDLPYPRERTSERFAAYRSELLTAFGLGSTAHSSVPNR